MLTSVAHQLQLAQQHYQTGDLSAAEAAYRQVVQEDSQQMEALFWLALIADQQGRSPDSVIYYQQVLALQPNSAEAHSNLGSVLLKLGRLEDAIAHHRASVRLMSNNAKAHYNLAIALYEHQQVDEAIQHYQQAVVLMPDYANAHHNLGMALYRQEKIDDAIAHYRTAVALEPHHASAHNSLGVALYRKDKLDDAIEHYRQAIAQQPNYISAHDNLGIALKQQGKLDEATHHFQRAIALHPEYANAYINLGNTMRDMGDINQAIAYCQEAIRLQPNNADAHNSYGCLLVDLCRFHDAIASFETAVRHRPDFADAHLNLGIILLQIGDFQRGLPEYHWRWKTKQCPDLRYTQALWDGSNLEGKTILLTAEQGFGDTIQFARYAPLVAQRGGTVIIACQKPLVRLLSTIPGVSRCVDRDKDNVDIHTHAPFLELPYLFQTTLNTIPKQIPYLSSSPHPFIPTLSSSTFNIGFVWATNPSNSTATRRSATFAHFLSLLEIPNISLYSLQKDPPEADRPLLQTHDRVYDLSDQLNDFADTATAIAQLDLIITVDTAVAHLAGALGKPTWTLLPHVADWRWLLDREDTPWYPTMRLFRQTTPGDWVEVFGRVAQALRQQAEDIGQRANGGGDEEWRSMGDEEMRSREMEETYFSAPTTPHPFIPSSSLTLSGFNRIKQCRHGVFLHTVSDVQIGRSLDLYGEWSEGEVQLFQSLVKLGNTVVEVGAGIGTHTVVMAKAVGLHGKVVAIEPQRSVFQNLCANLALNSITNTYTYQIALGETSGFIPLAAVQSQTSSNIAGMSTEQVQVATLDSFNVPQCHLLKMDVDQMLAAVIQGAQQTLERCQPLLYVVCDRALPPSTMTQLKSLNYDLYWHRPALYNPQNAEQNSRNVFGSATRHNILGFPRSLSITVNGMERVI
jgi:FkbM family methyltransferase